MSFESRQAMYRLERLWIREALLKKRALSRDLFLGNSTHMVSKGVAATASGPVIAQAVKDSDGAHEERVARAGPIPILTYHQIERPSRKGVPFRSLSVPPAAFRRHMSWLAELGYRGLSMRDLEPYLAGERSGKVFGLTFDDGFRNVQRNALPVLQALGFTATEYLVAGQVGGSNVWDAEKGVPAAPLMSRDDIRAWVAAGNEVGAHTVDHADLATLDDDAARGQIVNSRAILETLAGEAVRAFCYPYGTYRIQHVEMVRLAGFSSATTTNRGRVRAGDDLWRLPRVPVLRSTNFLQLLRKLFSGYEDRRGRA